MYLLKTGSALGFGIYRILYILKIFYFFGGGGVGVGEEYYVLHYLQKISDDFNFGQK